MNLIFENIHSLSLYFTLDDTGGGQEDPADPHGNSNNNNNGGRVTFGPCAGQKKSWHYEVYCDGPDYGEDMGSIMGCECCDKLTGGTEQRWRANPSEYY